MGYIKAAKERELIQAIIEFQKSNKYQQDFMDLFIVIYQATNNDDKLTYSEIRKTLDTAGVPAMPAYNPKYGLGFPKNNRLTNKEVTQLQEIIKKYQ